MSQPNDNQIERSVLLGDAPGSADFLHVPTLLETSQPRPRVNWLGPGVGILIVLILGSAFLSSRSPAMKAMVDIVSAIFLLLTGVAMGALMWNTVRLQRAERARIEAIEELVQLRRWEQAATMLHTALQQPALTSASRVQLLFFLAAVLARYNRFEDAITVQTHLLDTVELDATTEHALRLGRTMAMLREDHLFDADRAINELRRGISRAMAVKEEIETPRNLDEIVELSPQPPTSSGLALIEMYRDVKTGHPAEAIEMFNRSLPTMRRQLGHRISDAYALAAKAHDFLGDAERAQDHWEKATLLSPMLELARRYPELRGMLEKYRPAQAPAEAA